MRLIHFYHWPDLLHDLPQTEILPSSRYFSALTNISDAALSRLPRPQDYICFMQQEGQCHRSSARRLSEAIRLSRHGWRRFHRSPRISHRPRVSDATG